jgi:ubiquinone/menaquinone biosynthesis C-methylase UbiE
VHNGIDEAQHTCSGEVPAMQSDQYLLGRRSAEEDRLAKQVLDLEGEARWLLDRLDIRPGARAIDLGCGPRGGVLNLLAERVGPTGSVVGLEYSESFVASTRAFIARQGMTNVEVLQGDARATGLPRNSFDVAHMRLVLVNIPAPEQVVAEMVALVRPGGRIASHEADYEPHICDPPSRAWDRLLEVYKAYSAAHGIDLFVGRRTHRMFREAGVVDIAVNPVIHAYPPGHNRRSIFWDFIQNTRDRIVAEGFIGEGEMAALSDDLKRHLDDPRTLVVSHMHLQVWGRKPG